MVQESPWIDLQKPLEILVVEDSESTARALAALLKNAGYAPVVFLRAADALTHVSERPCLAAVLDVHLPDMNGLVLAQKLREQLGPTTPIIILSGDTSMTTLNSLAHVGATHFFSKPVHAPLLLERLGEWIREAESPASSEA